jgi:PadR family transcriptional regulator, regulatory protein PadR
VLFFVVDKIGVSTYIFDIVFRYLESIVFHKEDMKEKIFQRLYRGFMQLHILYHAKNKPVYGVWMMDELKMHGYTIGPGTIYPLLAGMTSSGLLEKTEKNVNGKIRKYYAITPLGIDIFEDAGKKAAELFHEIGKA